MSNQLTIQSNELEYYLARCQQEKATFNTLLERRNNAEDLVRHFENNNQEYVKIRRTAEEKVNAILSNAKPFIQLALYCIIESIKKNPYRYSPLVSENMPPSESYYSPDYLSYSNDRPTYFDSKALLAEEAANMHRVLSKDLAAEILANYTVDKSPRPSLPAFIPTDDDFSSTDKVAD